MANEQSINEIIAPEAFDQIDKLKKDLKDTAAEFVKAANEAAKFNQAVGKSSLKEFNDNNLKAAKAIEALRQAELKTIEIEERIARAREAGAQRFEAAVQKEIASQAKRTVAAKRLEEQEAKLKLKTEENQRAYAKLDAEHKRLVKDAQDLGVVLGENSVEFQEAADKANALDARLKAIDAVLGKNTRNVGNYKSAWNGLGNSINQITREFPAFVNSVQTGFMALSNNFPILFDEISRVRKEVVALRAEGKQVPGVFKQVLSSVFSVSTALSLGVTFLTLYGKQIVDFVAALFKGTKAIDYFAERMKVMQEVRRKGFGDAQTEIVNLQNLYRATQNTNLSLSERKKAVDELQRLYPTILGNLKDEDILAGRAAKSYQFLTQQILATAFASAASSKIAENRLREFDNEERRIQARIAYAKEEIQIEKLRQLALKAGSSSGGTGGAGSVGYYDQIAKAEERRAAAGKIIREANLDSEELNKRNLKLVEEIDKQVQKFGITALGVQDDLTKKSNTDEIDLKIQRAKNRVEELKEIAANENNKLEIRLDAAKKLSTALSQVAKLEAQKELSDSENTAARIKAIKEQREFDIRKAVIESNELMLSINDGAQKKLVSLLKKGTDALEVEERKKIQVQMDSLNEIMELVEQQRTVLVQKQSEMYAQGKISKEQYENNLRAIETRARRDSIREQLDVMNAIIAAQRENLLFGIGTQKELSDNERKATRLRIALSQLESDEKIAIKEREFERRKKITEKEIELAQEVFSFTRSLVDSAFERNIGRLEAESEAIEEKKNRDIEAVSESLLSEEEKADRVKVINAQAEANQKLIDQRIKAEKTKQAKADKAFALMQVALNTGIAVSKAVSESPLTFGLPWSAFAIATGALQAATILAQPIPKYKDGTGPGGHPYDGLAMVGDGYKHELRIDPDGSTSLTPNRPTITNMKKGTTIIGGDDLELLKRKSLLPRIPSVVNRESLEFDKVIDELRGVKKAIGQQKQFGTIVTGKGMSKYMANKEKINRYFQQNGVRRRI